MGDKQPTPEQVVEFWEWCGFTMADGWWYEPNGEIWSYGSKPPPIDLNNLFKYAIPPLYPLMKERGYYLLHDKTKNKAVDWARLEAAQVLGRWVDVVTRGEDPALALFWTIWQVMQEVK